MNTNEMKQENIDASVSLKIGTLTLNMINCTVYSSSTDDTMFIVVEDGANKEHVIELTFQKKNKE
jgi:hypothetical protein